MTGREYILSKLTNEQLATALFELDLACGECPIHKYCDKRHKEIIKQIKEDDKIINQIKEDMGDTIDEHVRYDIEEDAFDELGCDETYLEFMNKQEINPEDGADIGEWIWDHGKYVCSICCCVTNIMLDHCPNCKTKMR